MVRAPDIELNESGVIAQLEERLARFTKRIIFVEQLPRNTMGKVQKAVLREQYAGLYAVN